MIDKDNPIPLYIQLKQHLMEQIVSGVYPLGSQLPTEKELIKSLGLGRATVRAAVSELERDGIIIKRHGVGSFVAYRAGSLGFQPLMSLSYMLEIIGVKSHSRLVFDREVEVSSPSMCEKWAKGAKVHQVHRLRFAADYPIVLEDDFFTGELHAKMRARDLSGSLAQILLEELRLQVEKIEQTILLRPADADERATFGIGEDERVLEMTRWLYAQGDATPVSYLRFVMIYDLLQVPFEIFRGRKGR